MRFVLDTDVIVAAMRSPSGVSAALLEAALNSKLTLCANVALILEYEAVCSREEHLMAAEFSAADLDVFLTAIASLVEPVNSYFVWRPQLRDANDEMVLEAAVNGAVDAIVSFNLRDFGLAPARFGIDVMLPKDAIRRVKS